MTAKGFTYDSVEKKFTKKADQVVKLENVDTTVTLAK